MLNYFGHYFSNNRFRPAAPFVREHAEAKRQSLKQFGGIRNGHLGLPLKVFSLDIPDCHST
jgi:hypothetical protein